VLVVKRKGEEPPPPAAFLLQDLMEDRRLAAVREFRRIPGMVIEYVCVSARVFQYGSVLLCAEIKKAEGKVRNS